MGRLKTFLKAGLVAIALPGPLFAGASDLAEQFARCTGRLSAQMEFQWLTNDAAADRTEAERAAMISLLQAVTPPDAARELLHKRIEAKLAQSRLLTRATFNRDADDADWARGRAEMELGACRALILS